jgi:hypothetical protein
VPWPGYKKRRLVLRKMALESTDLRCHHITMVQPPESRKGLNLGFTLRPNFWPTCRRFLCESKVCLVFVIVEQVGRHQPFEMPLIQDDHVVQQVAPATSGFLVIGFAK